MPKITKQTMKLRPRERPVQDAWELSEHVSVLLFGASGTGKTTLWATFPDPILAIICSGGGRNPEELKSIDTPDNRRRITARICNTGAQIEEQLEEAKSGEYRTVVLDHGTGLQTTLLREELGVEELLQNSWGLAKREDYFAVALKAKEILYRLLSLPAHRVIVGQEKDHNEDEERDSDLSDMQVASIGADFSKSIIRWLNPACSFLVQTFKRPRMVEKRVKVPGKKEPLVKLVKGKGVDYCLRVGPHDRVITKFRKPKGIVLPDVLVDPDFDKMMSLIQGGE